MIAAVNAFSGFGSFLQWAVASLASVVVAVLVTGYRWRAMTAAAPAFPAGRLD